MTDADDASRAPVARPIASGDGWLIDDVVCHLGPQDRCPEERFGRATIAIVLDGTFQCRTSCGSAELYPGAFLLGNARCCFKCGHDHGVGDRCVAFYFEDELFEEIASSAAGSHRFRFTTAILPASSRLAWVPVESALHANGDTGSADELAIMVANSVIRMLSGTAGSRSSPLPRERKRIIRAMHYVQEHSEEPLTLADLCSVACMSKYHFLRSFRTLMGVTPHQFLLALRIRRAAVKLLTSSAPISAIAYEVGFGDLSTFNECFRNAFGATPRSVRGSRTLLPMPHSHDQAAK